MKNLILTCILIIGATVYGQEATTTIYMLRHAEKADNSADPELSKEGIARAESWGNYFKKVPIDYFFATGNKRSSSTISAIMMAQDKFLCHPYDAGMPLMGLANKYRGKTLLIVGHSDTIPAAINQLIGKRVYGDIPDNDYGYLYIITVTGNKVTHKVVKV